MDSSAFDRLSRVLGSTPSRRGLVALLAAGSGLWRAPEVEDVGAKKKHKKKKGKGKGGAAPTPIPVPSPTPGHTCAEPCPDGCCDSQSGTCVNGLSGQACGSSGATCQACGSGRQCDLGRCCINRDSQFCSSSNDCCGDRDCQGGMCCTLNGASPSSIQPLCCDGQDVVKFSHCCRPLQEACESGTICCEGTCHNERCCYPVEQECDNQRTDQCCDGLTCGTTFQDDGPNYNYTGIRCALPLGAICQTTRQCLATSFCVNGICQRCRAGALECREGETSWCCQSGQSCGGGVDGNGQAEPACLGEPDE